MYIRKKDNHKTAIFIIAITIVLIIVIQVTANNVPVVGNAVSYITSPVYNLINGINGIFTGTFSYVTRIGTLETDNQKLTEQNKKLEYENYILNEFKAENDDLRKLLGLKEQNIYNVITGAEVVGKDSGSYSNILILNKGKNSGVKENMVVISYDGLVGKIIEATDNLSKVMPITDERSSVSCMIQRSSEQVILKGDNIETGGAKLEYITSEMDIVEGDDIVTSNISEIYPEGIFVGKVKKIDIDSSNLTRKVYVDPAVKYKKLDKVLVIMGKVEG